MMLLIDARVLYLRVLPLVVFVCVGVSLAGCSNGYEGPELHPTAGTVVYKGSPIPEATVVFTPQASSESVKSLQAVTDEEGQFELFTSINNGREYLSGAPAGDYTVAVTKYKPTPTGLRSPPKPLLPRKYSNSKSSDLTATVVPDKENKFSFTLTD